MLHTNALKAHSGMASIFVARHRPDFTFSCCSPRIRRDVLTRVPITLWGKMMDRYLLHEDHTGWDLLNVGKNIVWHNERPTISDFAHDEHITSSLITYATDRLGHRGLSMN